MNTFHTSNEPLTVEKLLLFLQDLIKEDPSLLDARINHSEMGSHEFTHTIYLSRDMASNRIVVFSGHL